MTDRSDPASLKFAATTRKICRTETRRWIWFNITAPSGPAQLSLNRRLADVHTKEKSACAAVTSDLCRDCSFTHFSELTGLNTCSTIPAAVCVSHTVQTRPTQCAHKGSKRISLRSVCPPPSELHPLHDSQLHHHQTGFINHVLNVLPVSLD